MPSFNREFRFRIGFVLAAALCAVGIHGQDIPTLIPPTSFNPSNDAQLLRNAMQGTGTNEQQIIDVLCRRGASQRATITSTYNSQFNRDLVRDLQTELGGDFQKLSVSLTRSMSNFLAVELYNTMYGPGTDEASLTEILMSRTNAELEQIRNDFMRNYGMTLSSMIQGDVVGSLQLLFLYMEEGYRSEDPIVNATLVQSDVEALYKAAEGSVNGTDDTAFVNVFSRRSYPHIRSVRAEYDRISSSSLQFIIQTYFFNSFRDSLLSILDYANNKNAYFAQRLKQTTAPLGTDERNLSRQIVSRCEIDLGNIKTQYQSMFGSSLTSDVSSDTSGAYRTALVTLIG